MWLRFGIPYMLLITLVDLLFKMIARWDIHPMYFTCQAMIFGGFTLLTASRPGPLGLETLRAPATWAYGLLFLCSNAIFITSLIYLDIVTVNLITASSIIVTFVMSFLFMGRNRFTYFRSLMLLIIGVSVAFIISQLAVDLQTIAVLVAIAFALTQTIRVFIQETHKTSNLTQDDFATECRVTGLTLGITAVIFMIALACLAYIGFTTQNEVLLKLVPSPEQIFSIESLFFAAFYGILMLSTLRYMEFFWIKKIKAERFVLLMTILPVVTFGFEWLADLAGLVSFAGLTWPQIVAGLAIVIAAMGLEVSEAREEGRKQEHVLPSETAQPPWKQ